MKERFDRLIGLDVKDQPVRGQLLHGRPAEQHRGRLLKLHNHFRAAQYYRVWHWDNAQQKIVRVKDWTRFDIKAEK